MNTYTGLHIKFKEGKALTGTARYASIYTHKGYEQSRRDDLESLGYIFVYFFKGSLPWYDGDPFETNGKKMSVEKGINIKMNKSKERLCFGCPGYFEIELMINYFNYVQSLLFEATPNYEFLIKLFSDKLISINNYSTPDFDWRCTKV